MMSLDEYKNKYTEDDAPGWLAIDEALEKIYSSQKPKHWVATPHYAVGGTDPIDGISIYEAYENGEKYYHFVTYGFSNLYYDEAFVGEDYSRFGFELTFRLKPYHLDEEGPQWVFGLIQNIARYVFKSGKWFEPNHFMPANGPIRMETDTNITGFVFILDPELGQINTPHGEVQFLQMYGITDEKYKNFKEEKIDVVEYLKKRSATNQFLITELERSS